MRTLLWGLTAGWFGATAVGFGPIVILAITGEGLQALDDMGGVGRYLTWAFAAGTLGGITAGVARLHVRSKLGLRIACGIVLAEIFALQGLIFDGGELADAAGAMIVMSVAFFVVGFVVGPIMVKGLERSWPELHGWGAPAPRTDAQDS